MTASRFIRWFREIGMTDVALVGGKNASLGEMYHELIPRGIKVPDGFAITAEAYCHVLRVGGLAETIRRILADLDTRDLANLTERGRRVREAILATPLPKDLQDEIIQAYASLCTKYGPETDVAVRSSATAEDLPDASFAGQQESFLHIRGERALLDACQQCLASLFTDFDRLRRIAAHAGGFQVIYAGKAHPRDQGGKELITRIFQAKEVLKRDIKVVYLQNYDLTVGKLMTAGVDVWLNTPQPPLEASGTSGMKAALNGVPSFSVLDGWWIEGWIEGITGWAIGKDGGEDGDGSKVVSSLYDKLERVVIPLFYRERERFLDIMLHAIALNGSFFNAHRMMQQYVLKAYF